MHEPEKSDSAIVSDPDERWSRSPGEADEEDGAIRRGAGAAKGGDQGEREPAKHVPGAGPGKRVTGAGTRTASRKAKEEGEVHFALSPYRPGSAENGVLRDKA
jgi:hypothetical protein